MSNSNNLGKELKRLRKELAEADAKDRKFHFIVGDKNESAEAKLGRMKAEGKISTGDEYQLIDVPWVIHELKGSTYIPEGNPHDPLADPGLPPPVQATTNWGEQREREQRWKDHVKSIESAGERYDPAKPKDATWR